MVLPLKTRLRSKLRISRGLHAAVALTALALFCPAGTAPAASVPPSPPAQTERAAEPLPGDSETAYFSDLRVAPRQGTVGGGQVTLESPALSDPVLFLPGISRYPRPEEAEIKIGQLYLDLLSVSGSVLYTDNVDLEATDGEERTISILRLSAAAYYQLSENLRFGVAGRLIYLPQQGEFGVAGFGVDDPLFTFTRHPLFLAQVRYGATLNDWDLEVFNRFAVHASPSSQTGLGFEFDEEDRANRHVFRDPFTRRDETSAFLIRSNTVGASASRLIPTETRLTLGANHTDWWYDHEPRERFLPDTRDRAFVSLASERENLRFKPFASYLVQRYNARPWNHQVRSWIEGPLSDYIIIRGEAGYYWMEDLDRRGRLWLVRLRHTPRPGLYHQVSYSQSFREPLRDLDRTWAYLVGHQLNSSITAHASFERTEFEFLDRPGIEGDEWGAYAGFSAAVIADGSIAVRAGYEDRRFDNRQLGFRKSWLARTGVRHRSLQADILYRHTNRESPRIDVDYMEHVIMFTLTKFL